MAKKLADIKKEIDSMGMAFKSHLEESLSKNVFELITTLNKTAKVYIFSGIIRNYFLELEDYRDVDLFIDGDVDVVSLVKNYNYRRNSFGGYKINIDNTNVDLWFLKDTWALKNSQSVLDIELAKYIPNTAFFNFSSIMFSFNENIFYYTNHFASFIQNKKINLVFKPNANYALCVVNSFYYSDKFNLQLADKLKKHLKFLHKTNADNYEETQLKHFGKVIYTKEVINQKIEELEITTKGRTKKGLASGGPTLFV